MFEYLNNLVANVEGGKLTLIGVLKSLKKLNDKKFKQLGKKETTKKVVKDEKLKPTPELLNLVTFYF